METFTLFDSTPACLAKDFFGRLQLPEMHPMAYQPIFEPPTKWFDGPEVLTFQSDALNLAAACVQIFLRKHLEWFHIKIPAFMFEGFHRSMEKNGGPTVLLPFWCWCDGGPEKVARYRQHRHAIAVSPRGYFRNNVWKKITVSNEYYKESLHKNISLIDSPQHLVHLIDHLSNRKSSWRVSGVSSTQLNHFYINVTLPEHFKWVLVCLWEGGLTQLIYEEFKRLGPDKLAPYATWIHPSWTFYVKDLPTVPKDLVFPVSKHFFPTTKATEYFLHITNDKKLYFEKKECVLDEIDWGRVQANSGNVLRKVFGNDWIEPTSDEISYLETVEPLMSRKLELEQEVEKIKSELIALKEEKRIDGSKSNKLLRSDEDIFSRMFNLFSRIKDIILFK